MDAYDRWLALEADRSTLYPPTVPSKSPRRCRLSDVPSAYGGGRDRETGTRDLNAAIASASCAWVVWMIKIMAEKARERHLFVFRLSTLAAVVRPPSEARGAVAWDRAWT